MTHEQASTRRDFLKGLAFSTGALMLPSRMALPASAQTAAGAPARPPVDPKWIRQIGAELGSVRMGQQEDYESTLRRLAEIGYKEIEPVDAYNNMEPAAYRALLDKYGLKMHTSHSSAMDGP